MILDLEQERQNGLDESQLAERVMRLMGLSETCEGRFFRNHSSPKLNLFQCDECAYEFRKPTAPHPRVPKPLKEVRGDLIEWLWRSMIVHIEYGIGMKGARFGRIHIFGDNKHEAGVFFATTEDEVTALALAAVRLFGEKQDDKIISQS